MEVQGIWYEKGEILKSSMAIWGIIENRGLGGGAPKRCGIHSKPIFNVENLSFLVSRTLACAHMPVYVYACMKHVHTELEHACAYACMRTHALGFS